MSGIFITVEGTEGVGKSTAIHAITEFLRQRDLDPLTTREPGGTEIAEAIRSVLLHHYTEKMIPEAELLLMFAARAQHVAHVIKPALAAGRWVVCDRFTDASFAYQGGGRGISSDFIASLANWVHPDLSPDHTFLLDAPLDVAFARVSARGQHDRIEEEAQDFFARVRAAYLERARLEPQRFHIIDAAQAAEKVAEQIINYLREAH